MDDFNKDDGKIFDAKPERFKERSYKQGTFIGIGVTLGIVYGFLFHNIPIGICLGVAVGVAIDSSMTKKKQQ